MTPGIAVSPLFLELVQRLSGCFGVYRGVNASQAEPQRLFGFSSCRGASRLAADGSHRFVTSAWGHVASIASGRPFRPSQHTISASLEASVAYLGQYRQPVFGAFSAFAEPYPQHVFTAVHVHTNHHVRWAVDDSSVGSEP